MYNKDNPFFLSTGRQAQRMFPSEGFWNICFCLSPSAVWFTLYKSSLYVKMCTQIQRWDAVLLMWIRPGMELITAHTRQEEQCVFWSQWLHIDRHTWHSRHWIDSVIKHVEAWSQYKSAHLDLLSLHCVLSAMHAALLLHMSSQKGRILERGCCRRCLSTITGYYLSTTMFPIGLHGCKTACGDLLNSESAY